MLRLAVLLLAFAVLVPLQSAPSRADDPPGPPASADARRASKQHYQRGETAFALGKFKVALGHYEAAYEAAPYPKLLLNIGQCHANMSNYDRALFSFRKYLDLVPNAANRAEVERYVSDIERERDAAAAAQRALDTNLVPPVPAEQRPVYKRWWFIAGAAAVAAAAATTATITFWPDGGCQTDLCLDFD